MDAFDFIEQLKMIYQEQAKHEQYEVSKALFQTKMTKGNLDGPHVLKMIGYVEKFE